MVNVHLAILIKSMNVNTILDLNKIIFIVYTAIPCGKEKSVIYLK